MPFRSRNRLRPIHSVKHIIDFQGGTVLGVKTSVVLATAALDSIPGSITVENGSKIFGIFLNMQVYNIDGPVTLNNTYMIIYKNPGNNISPADIPLANAVGASDFRRQVFHQEMVMTGGFDATAATIPIQLFKGVIKIPRTFQTMRENDQIVVQVVTPGNSQNLCIQCIYKEFS